jgi:hypothetical protein
MSDDEFSALYRAARLLAAHLPSVDKFYNTIACIGESEKEMLSFCEVYHIMFPKDEKFNEWLKTVVEPALQKMGIAHWHPDLLSELAMKTARKPPTIDVQKEIDIEAEVNQRRRKR